MKKKKAGRNRAESGKQQAHTTLQRLGLGGLVTGTVAMLSGGGAAEGAYYYSDSGCSADCAIDITGGHIGTNLSIKDTATSGGRFYAGAGFPAICGSTIGGALTYSASGVNCHTCQSGSFQNFATVFSGMTFPTFVKVRFNGSTFPPDYSYGWVKLSDQHTIASYASEYNGGPITTGQTGPTAVHLTELFGEASPLGTVIFWQTASEIDTVGYNLWRSDTIAGQYVKINETLIPGEGSTEQEASYSHTDSAGCGASSCFYKLEDLDTHGVSTFHGPIEVAQPPRLCGTMTEGNPGFNIFSLFLPPAAAIALWLRRERKKVNA